MSVAAAPYRNPMPPMVCSVDAVLFPIYEMANAAPLSATSVANNAVFIPFVVTEPWAVASAYTQNGSVPTGNVDIGIYDLAGNRLASTGAVARSGASAVQRIALAYTLQPGRYYMAQSSSVGAANTVFAAASNATTCKVAGILFQAAAHPLPATATMTTNTGAIVPVTALGTLAF